MNSNLLTYKGVTINLDSIEQDDAEENEFISSNFLFDTSPKYIGFHEKDEGNWLWSDSSKSKAAGAGLTDND